MKKPYLYLIALLIFTGCNQEQKTKELKDLPKNEAALIKQFNNINDKLSNAVNEAGKQEIIDSETVHISNLVKKDFNLKVDQWDAYVAEVKTSTLHDDFFDVNVFIPLKQSYDKEHPTFNSITLKCQVKNDNKELMAIVKTLKPFDKVLVTGAFDSEPNENIKFNDWMSYNVVESNFVTPEFVVVLESISRNQ